MVDDWIYALSHVVKKPGKFVCLNGWWKGTQQTLELWSQLRPPGTELVVGSPYSHPADAREIVARCPFARWVDLSSPAAVVEEMRDAEAVFRAVMAPETFGVADVIAQIVGCRVHAYAPQGPGGAAEALVQPHGYTSDLQAFSTAVSACRGRRAEPGFLNQPASRIIPMWTELLDT